MLSALSQRNTALVIVAACHVYALGAFMKADRRGVVAVQQVGAAATITPVIWIAPLTKPAQESAEAGQGSWKSAEHRGKPADSSPISTASAAASAFVAAKPNATMARTSVAEMPAPQPTAIPDDMTMPELSGESGKIFFHAADTLDQRPVAMSEPDIGHLAAAPVSGLPVVLRVFVDRDGWVVGVDAIFSSEEDNAFVTALTSMLKATRFLPGKRSGTDVAAFFDLKLESVEQTWSGQ